MTRPPCRLQKVSVLLTLYSALGVLFGIDLLLFVVSPDASPGFIGLGVGSFVGTMLASGFKRSRSHKEGWVGALLAGLGYLGFGYLTNASQMSVSTFFSSILVCVGFGLIGAHLGSRFRLARRFTWAVSASTLFGATCAHCLLIGWVGPNHLGPLFLLLVPGTPLLVGAIVQRQSRTPVESSFVFGLAALTAATTVGAALGGAHASVIVVVFFACAIAATIAWACCLLGIHGVRRSVGWHARQTDMPTAVVLSGSACD